MFPSDQVPLAPRSPVRWTCGECGNDDPRTVRLDPSRPSLDDRYGVGYCDACTPARRGVKGIRRQAVALVRSDVFDRPAWLRQQAIQDDQDLLRRYRAGHLLSTEDKERVREIVLAQDAAADRGG